jgi:hypothetical protein
LIQAKLGIILEIHQYTVHNIEQVILSLDVANIRMVYMPTTDAYNEKENCEKGKIGTTKI